MRPYCTVGVCDRLVVFDSAVDYNQFDFDGCFDASGGAPGGSGCAAGPGSHSCFLFYFLLFFSSMARLRYLLHYAL